MFGCRGSEGDIWILPFNHARGLPGRAEKKVVVASTPEVGLTLSAGQAATSHRLGSLFDRGIHVSTGAKGHEIPGGLIRLAAEPPSSPGPPLRRNLHPLHNRQDPRPSPLR